MERKKEIWGGITTFLTMSYIVVVNPSILSTPGTGMSYSGVATATVLLSFLMTLLMGLYAKLPFAVAPGMGINAFFTFSLILGQKLSWQEALGAVFWAGIFFLILSLTRFRSSLAEAIPEHLRGASAIGIGLFLAFIGFKNAGLIGSDPNTLVKFGELKTPQILSLLGLLLMLFFMRRKNPAAFIIGIAAITALSLFFGLTAWPQNIFSLPDFGSVLFKLDPMVILKLSVLPAILSIAFTDLFDSISTFVGLAQASHLVDKEGKPKNLREGLIVDAWATLGAGLLGTSSGTAYIESAAGVEVGGRTGLTAVVTALCFLPCLFIAPLAAMVPAFATAPVLILVGALMFRSAGSLKLDRLEDLLPSFLTIALIPLTFSITQGLLWGFISHVLLYLMAGRQAEVKPLCYLLALISVFLLILAT